MKNFLIVNPVAGKGVGEAVIKYQIDELDQDLKNKHEFFFILTSKEKDATNLAKKICEEHLNENINIFACGGDGTCFEVLNGVIGYDNVSMGIIPVGSCNDFLKTFPEYEFMSLKKQLLGSTIKVDTIEINNEYALNVTNFGFDARANYDQIRYRKNFKTVKSAYNYALFRNIISPKLGDKVDVFVDDKLFFSGKMFLSSVANAMYYGGGYKCAPLADYQDGLLDVCLVRKVSLLTFLRLVKYYKKGEHLSDSRFQNYVKYVKGEKIVIKAALDLVGCLDGETRISKEFIIKTSPYKINFILPIK